MPGELFCEEYSRYGGGQARYKKPLLDIWSHVFVYPSNKAVMSAFLTVITLGPGSTTHCSRHEFAEVNLKETIV